MAGIGDGVHTLQLGVADATGRSTYDSAYNAKVNAPGLNPSPGGGSGLPDPGSACAGGTYASDGTTCVLSGGGGGLPPGPGNGASGPTTGAPVITTGGGGDTTQGGTDSGPTIVLTPPPATNPSNNGLFASPAAHISAFSGPKKRSVVSVPFGAATPVQGRLVDPTGKPVQGAKLTVLEKVGNGPWRETREISTDADGAFKYAAPAGKSRSLRFAYRANTEAATYDQTADVDLKVNAAVSIRPSHRVTSNGHSVTFTGRVPGTGKTRDRIVVLQAQTATGWFKFAYLKVDAHGRYSYTYRFTDTHATRTYTFRAVAKPAGYASGTSREVKVKVLGR